MRLRLTSQPTRHMCEPLYGIGRRPSRRSPSDTGLYRHGLSYCLAPEFALFRRDDKPSLLVSADHRCWR